MSNIDRITIKNDDPSPTTLAFGRLVASALPADVSAVIEYHGLRRGHEVTFHGPRGRTRIMFSDIIAATSDAAVVGMVKDATQYLVGGGS